MLKVNMKMTLFCLLIFYARTIMAQDSVWNAFVKVLPSSSSKLSYHFEKKFTEKISSGFSYISNKTYVAGKNEYKMQKYSIFARYWDNQTLEQGLFYELDFSHSKVDYDATAIEDGKGSKSGLGTTAAVGYHWQWENFNTSVAANISAYAFKTSFDVSDDSDSSSLNFPYHSSFWLNMSLGWKF